MNSLTFSQLLKKTLAQDFDVDIKDVRTTVGGDGCWVILGYGGYIYLYGTASSALMSYEVSKQFSESYFSRRIKE